MPIDPDLRSFQIFELIRSRSDPKAIRSGSRSISRSQFRSHKLPLKWDLDPDFDPDLDPDPNLFHTIRNLSPIGDPTVDRIKNLTPLSL